MIMNTIYLITWTMLVLLRPEFYPVWNEVSRFITTNYGY